MSVLDIGSNLISENENSNNAGSPNGAVENNFTFNQINDMFRADLARQKRSFNRTNYKGVVTGTGNAIELNFTVAPTDLAVGDVFTFKATAANTGATTVKLGSLTAIPLVKNISFSALVGGEITAGTFVSLAYNTSNFVLLNSSADRLPGALAVGGNITVSGAADFRNAVYVSGLLDINDNTARVRLTNTIAVSSRNTLDIAMNSNDTFELQSRNADAVIGGTLYRASIGDNGAHSHILYVSGVSRLTVTKDGLAGIGTDLTALDAANITTGVLGSDRLAGSYLSLVNVSAGGTITADAFTATTGNGFRGLGTDGAATPSFSWSSDLDTGIFYKGSGVIGFSSGGVEVATLQPDVAIFRGANPRVQLLDSDAPTTHNKTDIYRSNTQFGIRTVSDAGNTQSNDYFYNIDASGATDHNWRIGQQTAAVINDVGPVAGSTNTLITRQKGDARYAQLSAANSFEMAQTIRDKVTFTRANNTASQEAQINLNGLTGNRIDFGSAGVAAPSLTTRSVGTKLVLFPSVSPTSVDYALGIQSSSLWYSVPGDTTSHRWYSGTTEGMNLTAGVLVTLNGFSSPLIESTGSGFLAPADSATFPSYTWTADGDSGMYRVGTNSVGIATGGVNRATFNSAGINGVGTNITALNASNLSSGTVPDARITGAYTGITNITMSGTLSTATVSASGNIFCDYLNTNHTTATRSSDTIFYSSTDNFIRRNNATGMKASLAIDEWPGQYTGSSSGNTVFPIGSLLVCFAPDTNRGASIIPRLDAGDARTIRTDGAGTVITGTWRTRGYCGDGNYLIQRTA